MKLAKRFAALLMGATLVLGGVAGLAACGENSAGTNGGSQNVDDEQIHAIYDLYVANCAANNTTPETYEQWLASVKGDKGDPGTNGVGIKSVTLNADKELVIEFTDGTQKNLGTVTGAKGDDGVGIGKVEIDQSGNLVVTLTDGTSQTLGKVVGANGKGITKAEYKDGKLVITYTDETTDEIDLEIPQPHAHTWSQWSTVEAATCSSVGISKRTCEDEDCDSEEYKIEKQLSHTYGDTPSAVVPATCTENGVNLYVCSECGNVKGETVKATGHHFSDEWICDVCGADGVLKKYPNTTINGNGSFKLDVDGIEDGYYWLIAKTQTSAAANVLTVNSFGANGSSALECTYDMYSSTTNSFKGIVMVGCAGHDVLVYNKTSSDITADLTLVPYQLVTITAGEEIEVPCLPSSLSSNSYAQIPFALDSSLVSQSAKVTFTYWSSDVKSVPDVRTMTEKGLDTLGIWSAAKDKVDSNWSKTLTMPDAESGFYIMNQLRSAIGFNAVVKIELAEA